jgi:esterase
MEGSMISLKFSAAKWALVFSVVFSMLPLKAYAEPKWPLPEGVKSVEVNGYDMAYWEFGSGPPVVLVHGSVNDYRVWNSQVTEFSKKYHVIALSLRHYFPEMWDGHGDDYSIESHGADVAAFITKLNLGKVHLLGHSRGGSVVLDVAKKHPESIRTLILEDSSGLESLLPDTPESQRLAQEGRQGRDTLARNLASGNVDLAAQVYIDWLGGPGTWAKRTSDQKRIVLDNLGTASRSDVRPVTTCEQIAKFDFPILLVNGERSPKRYAAMFAAMRKCKDIAEPTIIPNAAHAMNRENPTAFNTAVLNFLDQN